MVPMSFQPQPRDIDWDIELQHLDEAEFLFQIWDTALESPNVTLAEIAAGPERRLLAHVDALAIAETVVLEHLLVPTIEDPRADHERVAAAVLASGQPTHAVSVLTEATELSQRKGIIRALESWEDPQLDTALIRALGSTRGPGAATLLELLARRRVPVDGSLAQYLRGDDPAVVRSAVWLAQHCTEPRVLSSLAALAQTDDDELRRTVIETALMRHLAGAWESAVYWAFAPTPACFRRDALVWVALLGDTTAQQRVLDLLDSNDTRDDAIWAAGFTGRVFVVDRCMELLADDQLGPLAAEAICGITGLGTDDERFWGPPAEPDTEARALPDLEHDDLFANLVPRPEAALPRPLPDAIARWWQDNRSRFDPRLRYLGGRPITAEVIVDALWHAPARRRHNLALELGLRTGAAAAVDTRMLSAKQKAQLERLPALEPVDFQRGYPIR